MTDSNRYDPDGFSEGPDPASFSRDYSDPQGPGSARSSGKLNIRDYYRYEEDAFEREYETPAEDYRIEEEPEELSPEFLPTFDSAPAWHPARAAEALAKAQAEAAAAMQAQPEAEAEAPAAPETDGPPLEEGIEPPAGFDEAEAPPEIPNWKKNPLVRFGVVGGFLGIVFGACIIGFTWLFGAPDGPYDLGNSFSTAAGLKGHLYTKWDDDKLQYRLSIEPADSSTHAGFAFAVNNQPHPLSFAIQLKDAMGFVLCTRDIVLRYTPGSSAEAAQTPGKGDSGGATGAPDATQLAAEEQQREQGKDVFQPLNGSDGQVASLSAQGQIPCSDKAYSKVVAWSFTPSFPSLTEQTDLMRQQAARQAEEERRAYSRKHPQKPVDKTLGFSIEGDESIVGYDAASGALETGTGEQMYVDKKEAAAVNLASWQAFPIRIHYRCDQTSFCTLTREGSGAVVHARMRR